jgi:hypothetical protein
LRREVLFRVVFSWSDLRTAEVAGFNESETAGRRPQSDFFARRSIQPGTGVWLSFSSDSRNAWDAGTSGIAQVIRLSVWSIRNVRRGEEGSVISGSLKSVTLLVVVCIGL